MGQLLGILPFRIRRTRSGAHSCSYEEGEFLNTPGLALLGLPATPGVGLWRADRCRIEWFGAARNGNVLPRVAGGPSSSGEQRLAAYDCRPPPPRSLIEVRQATDSPYATGCRPRQHGTKGGGFAPRYYSATHIWASTTRTETLLPNRVVGVNTNTRWAPPAPTGGRPAPLVAGRVFGSRRKGRRGFDHGLPRQFTDQWVATTEGWRWRRLQGGLRGSSPLLRR